MFPQKQFLDTSMDKRILFVRRSLGFYFDQGVCLSSEQALFATNGVLNPGTSASITASAHLYILCIFDC